MKRVIETDEVGGFEAVFGQKIIVFCMIYIYTGKLSAIDADHIELKDPKIVYETGPLLEGDWKDAQNLISPHRIMTSSIESWGLAKC